MLYLNQYNNTQRGFIGLLALLITAAIVAFLAVQVLTKLYRVPVAAPNDSNSFNQTRSVIDSAEEAKRAIEARSRGD